MISNLNNTFDLTFDKDQICRRSKFPQTRKRNHPVNEVDGSDRVHVILIIGDRAYWARNKSLGSGHLLNNQRTISHVVTLKCSDI